MRAYQTKEESRRFWWTFAAFMAADIAVIAVVLWVVK